jgi:formylglycine-generating enzyme required for sulfatase activity
VYVPSGTYTDAQQHFVVQGFFMMSGEVTNLDYREFLHHLKAAGRDADYEKARVRPEGWTALGSGAAEKAQFYHEFQAYEEYPVVNITQEAARLYCQWLTGKLQADNPDTKIEVRLPTEKEWMYAAQGGNDATPYPLGYYLRNNKGQYLYNFKVLGDESIHTDPATGQLVVKADSKPGAAAAADFFGPSPVAMYQPNSYGLYNTSGNVAEMLQEEGRTKGGSFNSTGFDIRIDAPDQYSGFKGASPYIGFRALLAVVVK